MGKLTCWILAITLLCSWCWPINGFDSMREYRGLGIYKEDAGKIALFLLVVVICEIGKKLDKDYRCPVYCDINHKHYFREKDEEKYEQEGNLQTVDRIYNSAGNAGKKQSAGSI
jgi:hypothetical protein